MKLITASKLGKIVNKLQWWLIYSAGAYFIGRFIIGLIFDI